jgi:uncharacterized membrane protein
MAWNLWLAVLPLGLAWWLFAIGRRPSPAWCIGVAAFVAFLPNAPYVLTDVIHLLRAARSSDDDLHSVLIALPVWGMFFAIGFGAYVLAVARVMGWLRWRGWSRPWLLGAELALHAVCAVGVFLGRFFRLNSWDVVTRPGDVVGVVGIPEPRSAALVLITFIAFAAGSLVVRYAGRRRYLVGRVP